MFSTRTYDQNGNLTNDGRFQYYYDCENRLTDVNDANDSRVASYKYDYAGRRVRKVVHGSPDVITRYVYDGEQIAAELDVNGVTETYLRRFIYGPGIDEPVAMRRITGGVGKWYYYHYDGLGSVVAISDSSGKVVERYSYDVFGEAVIRDANNSVVSVSSVANPYMFTGRNYDSETGLYYYRARYYSPAIGRFLQADPLEYEDSTNLYVYVQNNPINATDPTGTIARCPWGEPAGNRTFCRDYLNFHPAHWGKKCYREVVPKSKCSKKKKPSGNQCCYKNGEFDHQSPDNTAPAVGGRGGNCDYDFWRVIGHIGDDVLGLNPYSGKVPPKPKKRS